MITIIFAPPRTGKTCFLTHLACVTAYDRTRTRAMQNELLSKHENGFTALETLPPHCVSANYDMRLTRFGYTPRHNRRINPFRLGFNNDNVQTHFNIPYEAIFITEAQKYLNSRMSAYFPDWQSRWYEQHGHNNIDIYLDTQRPGLIDLNVRELARFIEIVKLDKSYDMYGNVNSLTWTIRTIDNSGLYERYLNSGKKEKDCYTESTVKANYNVFNCYSSQNCKPKFYDGHLDEDIDYNVGDMPEETLDAYVEFLREFDDELPENFYQKRSTKK